MDMLLIVILSIWQYQGHVRYAWKSKFVCFNHMQPQKVKIKSVQLNMKQVSYLFQICEDCHPDMFPEVRDFVNQDLPLLYPLKSYSKVSRSVLQ